MISSWAIAKVCLKNRPARLRLMELLQKTGGSESSTLFLVLEIAEVVAEQSVAAAPPPVVRMTETGPLVDYGNGCSRTLPCRPAD